MKAVRIHTHGGPEVLQHEDVPTPEPGQGQVLVQIQASGVNFVDTYVRSGLYPQKLPMIIGQEAAGVVAAVGPGVTDFKKGDLVAYQGVTGAYAEYAAVSAERVVKVPRGIDATTSAAVLLQGMTAHYLSHSTFPLKKGHTALIHAGAGGVGLLLIQIAKRLGAEVITTVSTPGKASLVRGVGADHVILYTNQDFEAEVKRITGGRGVDVVYDGVGKTTFDKSIASLTRRGYMVLYGQASGPVPAIDIRAVLAPGSRYVTRPGLQDYTVTREELLKRANEVFNWVKSGELKVRIFKTLPLSQAAEAHRLLQGRESTGKIVLVP